jgi:hypothetical protein
MEGKLSSNEYLLNTTGMNWLVVLTILKNISQWEGLSHIFPYIMENKKCSKPPTSNVVAAGRNYTVTGGMFP